LLQDRKIYRANNEDPHPSIEGHIMQFAGIENPFGTAATIPAAIPTQSRTLYYKGLRLNRMPVQIKAPRAPKPISHTVKNFLLNYNG